MVSRFSSIFEMGELKGQTLPRQLWIRLKIEFSPFLLLVHNLYFVTKPLVEMDETSEQLDSEDERVFQQLYLQGLKSSSKTMDESSLVPKFYSKVRFFKNIS